MKRYLTDFIEKDMSKKMVFLGGPRQVGKTTLALGFLNPANEQNPAYRNWDDPTTRKALLAGALPLDEPVIILDEIHKYKKWRNLVKGFYDTKKSTTRFLITGSAKLDYYRKGGDSLLGRYFFYRLHPLSLFEVSADGDPAALAALLRFGGFPEMYFAQDTADWRRWQRDRITRVIRDDLLSVEQVRDVTHLELLAGLLEGRVGSPLSLQSLCQDVSVSHDAMRRWLLILEAVYLCYRISPYGSPKIKALKKEQKLYLWDWSSVENPGAKFENLVASNLLKFCHFREDILGEKMELRYLRDKDGREVDFVVIADGLPLFAVECKSGARSLSKSIPYFSQRTDIPIFYQIHLEATGAYEIPASRARVMSFALFATTILKI